MITVRFVFCWEAGTWICEEMRMMVDMARRNHWSLRNQRSQREVFFHFGGEGLVGLWGADWIGGGEGVFSSPSTMFWRFVSSFPITSVISSSLSRVRMSSFDESFDGVVDVPSIAVVCEV